MLRFEIMDLDVLAFLKIAMSNFFQHSKVRHVAIDEHPVFILQCFRYVTDLVISDLLNIITKLKITPIPV